MSDDTRSNDPADTRPSASQPSGSIEVIKADIERTQAELVQTIEALQWKLHPRRLIGGARGAAKGYVSRLGHGTVNVTIRGTAAGAVYAERAGRRLRKEIAARPASALLIGSGLASLTWLWLTRRPAIRRTRRSI